MIEGLIAGVLAASASAFVTPFLEPAMRIGTVFTWPPWRGLRNHPFYWAGIIATIAIIIVTNVLIGVITDDEKVLAVRSVVRVRVGVAVLNAVVGFFIIPGLLYFPKILAERQLSSARGLSLYEEARRQPTTEARMKRAGHFLRVGWISQETYDQWRTLLEDDE